MKTIIVSTGIYEKYYNYNWIADEFFEISESDFIFLFGDDISRGISEWQVDKENKNRYNLIQEGEIVAYKEKFRI